MLKLLPRMAGFGKSLFMGFFAVLIDIYGSFVSLGYCIYCSAWSKSRNRGSFCEERGLIAIESLLYSLCPAAFAMISLSLLFDLR